MVYSSAYTPSIMVYITDRGAHIEVAVSATVLPVELNILPHNGITFGQCLMGKHIKQKFTIQNASNSLPIHYTIKPIAHYKISRHKGRIDAGGKQELEVMFMPRQMGTLNSQYHINVIAPSSIKSTPDKVIYSTTLKVSGVGISPMRDKVSKLPQDLSSDRAASIRPHDRRQLIK